MIQVTHNISHCYPKNTLASNHNLLKSIAVNAPRKFDIIPFFIWCGSPWPMRKYSRVQTQPHDRGWFHQLVIPGTTTFGLLRWQIYLQCWQKLSACSSNPRYLMVVGYYQRLVHCISIFSSKPLSRGQNTFVVCGKNLEPRVISLAHHQLEGLIILHEEQKCFPGQSLCFQRRVWVEHWNGSASAAFITVSISYGGCPRKSLR